MTKIFFTLMITLSLASHSALAKDLLVSLANIPNPGFSLFLDEMAKHHKQGGFEYVTYPFPRSVKNAIKGKTNFHMPLLKNPLIPNKELPYVYSTESFAKVSFVIYSNNKKKLSRDKLNSHIYSVTRTLLNSTIFPQGKEDELKVLIGEHYSWPKLSAKFKSILGGQFWTDNNVKIGLAMFPYKIETERNHVYFFPFPTIPTSKLGSALKKVNAGRTDGFVLAQEECDSIIRTNKLSNIHRALYQTYDAKFIIGRSTDIESTDKSITMIIEKMKQEGSFERLSTNIHGPYIDWQPYKSLQSFK